MQQPILHSSSIPLPRRRGVVAFEFIIWLPILVILLLAIVEFAQIYAVDKQVQEASRFGAKIASELDRAALRGGVTGFDAATAIKAEVDDYLESAGLTASCQVILEHNTCIEDQEQVSTVGAPAGCLNCTAPPTTPALPTPANSGTVSYVRITVCVDLEGNVPNCLQTFGFNIDDCVLEHSTTFRIEDDNDPPTGTITSTLPGGSPAGTVIIPAGAMDGTPITGFRCAANGTDVVLRFLGNQVNEPSDLFNSTIDIEFDASLFVDPEDPGAPLTYSWTTTAAGNVAGGVPLVTPAAGVGTTFTATFNIPYDPDADGAPNNMALNSFIYTITVSVTDNCGATGTCTYNLRFETVDNGD